MQVAIAMTIVNRDIRALGNLDEVDSNSADVEPIIPEKEIEYSSEHNSIETENARAFFTSNSQHIQQLALNPAINPHFESERIAYLQDKCRSGTEEYVDILKKEIHVFQKKLNVDVETLMIDVSNVHLIIKVAVGRCLDTID